jgi:hypothetical protein
MGKVYFFPPAVKRGIVHLNQKGGEENDVIYVKAYEYLRFEFVGRVFVYVLGNWRLVFVCIVHLYKSKQSGAKSTPGRNPQTFLKIYLFFTHTAHFSSVQL